MLSASLGLDARALNTKNTKKYEKYKNVVQSLSDVCAPEDFFFINAWNEWGEGMALEALIDSGTFISA